MGTTGTRGVTGPPPKRSEERRRRNKTTESGASNEVEKLVVDPDALADISQVPAPDMDPDWHPLAKMVYMSAQMSAMREFYEPTDWATLFITVDQLSRHLQPQPIVIQSGPQAGQVVMVNVPMPGTAMQAINKVFTSLMFTEGDRRRLRLEIERQSSAAGGQQDAPTGENVIAFRSQRLSS